MAKHTDESEPTLRDVLDAITSLAKRVGKLEASAPAGVSAALPLSETIYGKGIAADAETGERPGCSHIVVDTDHPHGVVPFGHFGSEGDAQEYISAMRRAGHPGRLAVQPVSA